MKRVTLPMILVLLSLAVSAGSDKGGGNPEPQGGICVDPNGRPVPCPPAV